MSTSKENPSFLQLSARLNSHFAQNLPAYDVIDEIRAFPRPILVDFNGVLADDYPPYEANPKAKDFLEKLREMGNIFIVTNATDWTTVNNTLQANGHWFPDMNLMVSDNYRGLFEHGSNRDNKWTTLVEEFIRFRNLSVDINHFSCAGVDKRVGPIFGKPFDIPLIDDYPNPTKNNPGILGILVNDWVSNPDNQNLQLDESLPFNEAIKIVREHYNKLSNIES